MCYDVTNKTRRNGTGWKLFFSRRDRLESICRDFFFTTNTWIASPAGPGFFLYPNRKKVGSDQLLSYDECLKVKFRNAKHTVVDGVIVAQEIFIIEGVN